MHILCSYYVIQFLKCSFVGSKVTVTEESEFYQKLIEFFFIFNFFLIY